MTEELKREIEAIRARNEGVTADKAWETSKTRRILIAVYTYLVAWAYLAAIGVGKAYLHALVPPGAFLISTLTMPYAKKLWLRHYFNN